MRTFPLKHYVNSFMTRMSSIVNKFSAEKEFVIKEVELRIISLRLFYFFLRRGKPRHNICCDECFLDKKKMHSVLIKAIMQEVEGLRD